MPGEPVIVAVLPSVDTVAPDRFHNAPSAGFDSLNVAVTVVACYGSDRDKAGLQSVMRRWRPG